MKRFYFQITIAFLILFSMPCIAQGGGPGGTPPPAPVNELWGMTQRGGPDDIGVIFKTDSEGNGQTVVYNFEYENPGINPDGSELFRASNDKFYGITRSGGANSQGVLFEYSPQNEIYTKLIDFDGTNGRSSDGSTLVEANNGKIYGTTTWGGSSDNGVLFEFDINTNVFTKRVDFNNSTGSHPISSLMLASNGKLYGMTSSGGANGNGVIYEFDTITNTFSKKFDFDGSNTGGNPRGSLVEADNGKFYGMTLVGGNNNVGVLFEFDFSTDSFTKKLDFDGTNLGRNPYGGLVQTSNGILYGMTSSGGATNNGVLFEFDTTTDSYSKKYDFDGANSGSRPYASLEVADNGKLYGMTKDGGSNGSGVLFEYNPTTNMFLKKYDFLNNDGSTPKNSLVKSDDGKLYGMTSSGGNGSGVLFEFNTNTDTYLKKFNFNENIVGSFPRGSLLLADNGKFYGMTPNGGSNNSGVLFEFDPTNNTYTKIQDFNSSTGTRPYGSLIQASNGKLYGLTDGGWGGIFEFNITTNLCSKIYDFPPNNSFSNGRSPEGSLVEASNGKLYGTTKSGGANNKGVLFEFNPIGNIFTKKYDYPSNILNPSNLVQANNGKLYGTTQRFSDGPWYNPIQHGGTLFEFNPNNGAYNQLISFNFNDGTFISELVLGTNGKIYGKDSNLLYEFDPSNNSYTALSTTLETGNVSKEHKLIISNGKFYGVTGAGGSNGGGVLFEYDLSTNTYVNKLNFNGTNGANPYGHLAAIFNPGQSCELSEVTTNITDTTCATAEDGEAQITINFSGAPVAIEGSLDGTNWFPFGTPSSNPFVLPIDNLAAGNYSVTVREVTDLSCEIVTPFTIGTLASPPDNDGDGFTVCDGDCDDNDGSVFPGATEICDGIDNNCDGNVDESGGQLWYADSDNDGFGDANDPGTASCFQLPDTSDNNFDCNDGNSNINPNAQEVCDGVDNNCDGTTDEGFDQDGDGVTVCGGDCDDTNASVYPGAPEINCDGLDNDCNPVTPDNQNPVNATFNVTGVTYGPVTPLEYGVDFVSGTDYTFGSTGSNPGEAGGRTWIFTDLIPTNYGGLWFTFNNIENPRHSSQAPTGSMTFYSFDANTGVATFRSTAPLTWINPANGQPQSVNTQFRMQIQPVGATGTSPMSAGVVGSIPNNIVDGGEAGLPGLGLDWSTLDVSQQGDFQVWFAFEVQGTNQPLTEFYNNASTPPNTSFFTSVYSSFFAADDVCVNPGNELTVTAVADANNTAPFIYTFNDITNTTGVFSGITAGTFDYSIMAANGCLTN